MRYQPQARLDSARLRQYPDKLKTAHLAAMIGVKSLAQLAASEIAASPPQPPGMELPPAIPTGPRLLRFPVQ